MKERWFDFWQYWDTGRASALAAGVGAIAAAAASFLGVRTYRQRSRPMVAAELRDDPYIDAVQYLIVRNYGPSIARRVRVTFDPPIPDPADLSSSSMTPFLKRRYSREIAILTPGMELDNIYFSGNRQSDGWVNREPMPDQVTVRISYEDDHGHGYTDEFPLDVNLIRDRTYAESSASPDGRRKAMLEVMKRIDKNIAGLNRPAPAAPESDPQTPRRRRS